MIKHKITLKGDTVATCRVSGLVLKDLLDILIDGARGALRLQVEGRSFAPGASPKWLDDAADFQVVGLSKGSTVIQVETQSLADAAPEKFRQLNFFRDHTASAFSLFEMSLADALDGKEDSDLYDELLLNRYAKLNSVFERGVDSIRFSNGARKGNVVSFGAHQLSKVASLQASTPKPQAVKVSGRLETIRFSDKMFELITAQGLRVRGVASAGEVHLKLKDLFGQNVTVDGVLVYRPSGTPMRIDASSIELSRECDIEIWSSLPIPGSQKPQIVEFHQPQGRKSGLSQIWGKWPGDETEAQVSEALKSLRESKAL